MDVGEYDMVAGDNVHGPVIYTCEHTLAMQWMGSNYCAICSEVDDLDPPRLFVAWVLGLPHDIPDE